MVIGRWGAAQRSEVTDLGYNGGVGKDADSALNAGGLQRTYKVEC